MFKSHHQHQVEDIRKACVLFVLILGLEYGENCASNLSAGPNSPVNCLSGMAATVRKSHHQHQDLVRLNEVFLLHFSIVSCVATIPPHSIAVSLTPPRPATANNTPAHQIPILPNKKALTRCESLCFVKLSPTC